MYIQFIQFIQFISTHATQKGISARQIVPICEHKIAGKLLSIDILDAANLNKDPLRCCLTRFLYARKQPFAIREHVPITYVAPYTYYQVRSDLAF